jgi:Fe-S-cluster containining protein
VTEKMTDKATPAARDQQGRVHLSLVRDAASGEEAVTLAGRLFDEQWQDELAAGAANTAHAACGREPALAGMVALARNLMAATSRVGEALLARAPAAVACRPGCDHCCYQSVGVTPPEALAIFDHLSQTRSDAELAGLAARARARRAETRDLSAAERFSPAYPCLFLEAGRCSIYDVRPLSCRGMNSLDAGECERRLRDPEARAAFRAAGTGGHSFVEPIAAFHAISAGLQLALSELHRLDMRPLDLVGALDLLLNGADTIPDDWIGGGTPFEPAVSSRR